MSIDLQPELESVKAWLQKRAKDAKRESVEDYLGHMKFEEVYEMMARYGRQRMIGLVGPSEPKQQVGQSGWDSLFKSFHSQLCPGCDGPKQQEFYFCTKCWHKIPTDQRKPFYHGLKISALGPFFGVVKGLRKG